MEEQLKFKKVAARVLKVLDEYQDENGKPRTPFLVVETATIDGKTVKARNIRTKSGKLKAHADLLENELFIFNERV